MNYLSLFHFKYLRESLDNPSWLDESLSVQPGSRLCYKLFINYFHQLHGQIMIAKFSVFTQQDQIQNQNQIPSYDKDRNINKPLLSLHVPILILALNTRVPTVLQKQKDGEILNLCNNFIILKVQSCKLYNSKYMIASSQITNTEILAVIAVLIFKLLSCKVLFINRKDNRNC